MSDSIENGEPTAVSVGANPYNTYGLATQGFVWAAISSVSGNFDGRVKTVNRLLPDDTGNVNVTSIRTEDYSGEVNEIHADLTVLSGDVEYRLLTNVDYNNLKNYADGRIDELSGDSEATFAVLSAASGGWNNAETEIQSSSADWHNVETKVETTSGQWDAVYSSVVSISSKWDNSASKIESSSANYDSAYESLRSLSSDWENVTAETETHSSNWNSVYTSVSEASAKWNDVDIEIETISANAHSVYTSVKESSAGWDNAQTKIESSSGDYDAVYSLVNSVSSDWNNATAKIAESSGNYDSVYASVIAASSGWNNAQTEIQSSSADWHNVETKVESTSGNWDSAYSSMVSMSSGWDNARVEIESTSADWNNVETEVENTSGNWNSVYGSVESASSGWNNVETKVSEFSGYWDSSYATLQEASGRWDSTDAELSLGVARNAENIANLESLVPQQASQQNQLADKAFVNSSIQTSTANFRGNWEFWTDVPTASDDYPEDYAGHRTPTVNDYLIVQEASGYVVEEPIEGTWRFKYSGIWAVDGKEGWLPEYQVNETPFTAAQLAAINSGITSAKLDTIDSNLESFGEQLYNTNVIVGQNTNNIGEIYQVIPAQASAQNKLVDAAAMSAALAQKADASALDSRPTKAQIDEGWWSEWTITPADVFFNSVEWRNEDTEYCWYFVKEQAGTAEEIFVSEPRNSEPDAVSVSTKYFVDDEEVTFTAIRHRVAAPVPTNPGDIGAQVALSDAQLANIAAVPNKADTSDVVLSPIYSQTPTFTDWVVEPALPDGYMLAYISDYGWCIINEGYELPYNPGMASSDGYGNETSTSIIIDNSSIWSDQGTVFAATRTRTDIVGYTLGSQTTKPLQPQGDYITLLNEEPSTPKEREMWPDSDDGYVIWQNGEAHALGGGSSITVDDALSATSTNPVQNKVVTAAVDAKLSKAEAADGFTTWIVKRDGTDVTAQVAQPSYDSTEGAWYVEASVLPSDISDTYYGTSQDATELTWNATDGVSNIVYTATRTRLPTMADIPTDNAQLTNGAGYATTTAMNTALSGKADASALPYALVDVTVTNGTATLTDRAVNAVLLSAATTLTMPAISVVGHARDFLVRITISASAAVTFAAAAGETLSWDSLGDPSGMLASGTHLLHITEVATGVFHAEDTTSMSADIDELEKERLYSTSVAPAFSTSATYVPGDHITDNGILYECIEASTGTFDISKWKSIDMTTPDATLDITSEGRLSVVSGQGEVMWMEGYGLSNTSSSTLVCGAVQLFAFPATTATVFSDATAYDADDRVIYDGKIYKFTEAHAAGTWIGTDAVEDPDMQEFTLPTPPAGIVGDFVLDIDNSANADAEVKATLAGVFTGFDVITPKGEVLTDMLTFAGGEMCELDFTQTAFGSSGKTAWKVVKQVVEKQEAGL